MQSKIALRQQLFPESAEGAEGGLWGKEKGMTCFGGCDGVEGSISTIFGNDVRFGHSPIMVMVLVFALGNRCNVYFPQLYPGPVTHVKL